jgi:hypothetical protein
LRLKPWHFSLWGVVNQQRDHKTLEEEEKVLSLKKVFYWGIIIVVNALHQNVVWQTLRNVGLKMEPTG